MCRQSKVCGFFIVFAKIAINCGEIQFNDEIHQIQESGAHCVVSVANMSFDVGSSVAVITSGILNGTNRNTAITTDFLILQKLMTQSQWSIIMKKGTAKRVEIPGYEKIHNYILILKSDADLKIIIKMLTAEYSWNPHAKFLVYVIVTDIDWRDLVLHFIEELWQLRVINLSFIVPDSAVFYHRIVTWFPFNAHNCGKQQSQLVEVGACKKSIISPPGLNVFAEKVPQNLNRCPINIIAVVWPPFILAPKDPIIDNKLVHFMDGIEIVLMQTLAEHANFTPLYRSFAVAENWGDVYANKTGSGMLGVLIRHEADIAIGTITPTCSRHEHFDFTVQYMQDKTTWIVPVADSVPQWQNLLKIFTPTVWIMTVISFFCGAITLCLLAKSVGRYTKMIQPPENEMFIRFSGSVFVIWSMLVTNSVGVLPRSNRLRSFLFIWSLFSFHWCTSYTSSLISMLTTPSLENQITTVEGILDSGIAFGMTQPTVSYFRMEQFVSDKIGRMILSGYEPCESAAICLERISRKRDFAMALSRQFFKYAQKTYTDDKGSPLMRELPEDIVSPPVEMLLVKGHPLRERLNDLLLRIVQSGLIDYWTNKMRDESSISGLSDYEFQNVTIDSPNKILTLHHLQGAFIALGFGLSLSTVCFTVELLFARRAVKKGATNVYLSLVKRTRN